MAKLSIIIPVYNEEKTISSIIDSVQAVPLSDVEKEIIIVDDGSTDGTRAALAQFKSLGNCRVVFQEKNQGKGAAIKRGISFAIGELVLIHDSHF